MPRWYIIANRFLDVAFIAVGIAALVLAVVAVRQIINQ